MAILEVTLSQTGLVGVSPQVIYITTNDTYATVTTTGYLTHLVQQGYYFNNAMMALVTTTDQPVAWLDVVVSNGVVSLVSGNSPGIVTPGEVQRSAFNFAAAGGAADAYTLTLDPAPAAYTDGLTVTLLANHTNTTVAPTLNVNGLGAINIAANGGSPLVGDIVLNIVYQFVYNSANNNFTILNPSKTFASASLLQSNFYLTGVDTGAINAYVAIVAQNYSTIPTTGASYWIEIDNANSGPSTLNLNSSGVKNIVNLQGNALVGGELLTPSWAHFVYDGTNYVLQNSAIDAGTGTVNTALINELAYYAAAGDTVSGLATANSAALVTTVAGVPVMSGSLTNGQVISGVTGGTPVATTITASGGISVTLGSGSIAFSGAGGGIGWVDVAASPQAIAIETAYVANTAGLLTFSLPVTAAFGTVFAIVGNGAGGWIITQNAGQNIQVGAVSSTIGVGGSVASSNQYDSIDLVCTVANTTWVTVSAPQGILTVI